MSQLFKSKSLNPRGTARSSFGDVEGLDTHLGEKSVFVMLSKHRRRMTTLSQERTMTPRRQSIVGLYSLSSVVLVLALSIVPASAQRHWSYAADDGAGVSAFYDVDGTDVLLQFRNESTESARIEYQVSCQERGSRGPRQSPIASIAVSADRVAHARWTCSESRDPETAPQFRAVTVRLFRVTYGERRRTD